MKTTKLLALFYLLTLSGCVFISEPDVGGSSTGPDFQNETPDDEPSNVPPGVGGEPLDEGNAGGSDSNSTNNRSEDSGLPADASQSDALTVNSDASNLDIDADVANSDASIVDEDDATQPLMPDASMEMIDASVMPASDMMVDPPVESCDDIRWDCTSNGYCDPIDRPDCALSPGSPACYPFTNLTQTDPAAYARCCAAEGECMAGNFCEPENLDYCWLLGDGPVCYIRANPISEYICR